MRKKVLFVAVVLLAAALLTGCAGGAVRGTTWPGLAADDNTAYLADGPSVFAINLKDGKELWRYPADRDNDLVFYSTPVVTPDGLVIVGSAGKNNSLIALNPTDVNQNTNNINSPAVAWIFDGARDHWFAPPLVVNDKVFAVNVDGHLYVLDLLDGQSTKKAVKAIDIGGRLWAQPITDGERIFLTSLDHSVIALNIETYETLWHEDIEGAVAGSAVLGPDGMLYVGSLASQLERFDPASGSHESVFNANDWVWSTPSLESDTLYFGDLDGNFYSFNTSTGKSNWPPVKPDGPITASPLVLGDSILIATESGAIYQVSLDGQSKLWSQPGGQIYTTPVQAGDLILVAPLGNEAYLYAYNQDGSQAWQPFIPQK
jgi:outer membrane protein assembly factor BamB